MDEYMLRSNNDFMIEFKKGDVVQLNTGSPNMNVVGVSCGNVLCKWVSGNGTPCSDMFPIECLKHSIVVITNKIDTCLLEG